MESEGSVVYYDRAENSLRLVLSGGEEIYLRRLPPELEFRAVEPGAPPRLPLWLSQDQADILSRMIHHILDKVRISQRASAVLGELAPQVDELRDLLAALDDPPPPAR